MYASLKASLSMQHSKRRFDRVPMNKCATCPLQDGVHFAVDGRQRVIGRTLGECIDVSHLDSWSQGSFSHEHVGVHGVNHMELRQRPLGRMPPYFVRFES